MNDDTTFYATVAQVIPVLLLALAFERRFFQPEDEERASQSLFLLSFLTALVGGEVLAITVLLDEEAATPFTEALVTSAIAWGLLGLTIPLVRPRFAALARTLPSAILRAVQIGWLPLLLVTIIVAAVTGSPSIIPGAMFVVFLSTLIGSWLAETRESDDAAPSP